MEKKKIRDLAKGEYFILNPIEVELTQKTEVSEWIDENDESIAKAYLIDRVKDTRGTVIERNIERTIY